MLIDSNTEEITSLIDKSLKLLRNYLEPQAWQYYAIEYDPYHPKQVWCRKRTEVGKQITRVSDERCDWQQ